MALQHLRSSTADKRPTPAAMSDGQLALNTNLASPGLFFKDSNGDSVKIGPVHVGTTAPNATPGAGGQAGNSKGEQWLDTTGGVYVFKIYDGTAWRSETGTFVDVNGDTMTGALGIIAGSAASPGLFFSGDTNSGLYSPGADQVAVATNGTARLYIASDGKVGVGTTGPSGQLDVETASDTYINFSTSNNGSAAGICLLGNNNDEFFGYANDLRFATVTGKNAVGFNERMRMDSSGRLLVGTSTARTDFFNSASSYVPRFQLEGSDGSGTAMLSVLNNDSGGNPPYIILGLQKSGSSGGDTAVASGNEVGEISFQGNDGSEMVVAASIKCAIDGTPGANDMPGRLVFSVTSDGSASPTERARLTSTGEWLVYSSGGDTLVAGNTAGSGTSQSLFTGVHTRTSTTGGGTVAYRIYNNGTTFSISDARQKKNVETARDGYLEDLQQLRVVKYNWLDQADTESKELGLLAQEVAKVFPGLVQSADPSDPESTLGIKSSVFSFMLIKAALQEAGSPRSKPWKPGLLLLALTEPERVVPFSKMLGVGSPLVRTGGQRTWKVGSIPARPLAS
jgi:hypothetical protein